MGYKRLTGKSECGYNSLNACLNCDLEMDCGLCPYWAKALDRLADFENKKEQGTLIELPCKVGDTVYLVFREDKEAVVENGFVTGMNIDESGLWVYMRLEDGKSHCIHSKSKGLCFSCEQAEKRLKELQNG